MRFMAVSTKYDFASASSRQLRYTTALEDHSGLSLLSHGIIHLQATSIPQEYLKTSKCLRGCRKSLVLTIMCILLYTPSCLRNKIILTLAVFAILYRVISNVHCTFESGVCTAVTGNVSSGDCLILKAAS